MGIISSYDKNEEKRRGQDWMRLRERGGLLKQVSKPEWLWEVNSFSPHPGLTCRAVNHWGRDFSASPLKTQGILC